MGRELKRVPLDFDWPLNKPWEGFVNPHYTAVECSAFSLVISDGRVMDGVTAAVENLS